MASISDNVSVSGISIVIPTIGRESILLDTVKSLSLQLGVKYEIIIVTQSVGSLSDVEFFAIENRLSIKCFYQSEPNASLARNVGLVEARYEVVLFVDDDMTFDSRDFLKNHLAPYADSRVPGVAGQVLAPGCEPRTRPLHRFAHRKNIGWLYFPPNWHSSAWTRNGISCNLSVRRKFAIDVGGMDSNYIKGAHREESDFCLRLTDKFGPLLFSHRASAIHLHIESGGCRSWNNKGRKPNVYAIHHCIGEWYFILNGLSLGTVCIQDLPDYLFALIRRQLWNRPNGNKFRGLLNAMLHSTRAFFIAVSWLTKGRSHIDLLDRDSYHLMWKTT